MQMIKGCTSKTWAKLVIRQTKLQAGTLSILQEKKIFDAKASYLLSNSKSLDTDRDCEEEEEIEEYNYGDEDSVDQIDSDYGGRYSSTRKIKISANEMRLVTGTNVSTKNSCENLQTVVR